MPHARVRRDEHKGLLDLVDDSIRCVEIVFRNPMPEFEQIEAPLGRPHTRSLRFTALGTQRTQLVEDLLARNALATRARGIRIQNGAAKGEAFVLREDGCADRFISVRELAGANIFLDRFPEIVRKGFDRVGLLHGLCLPSPFAPANLRARQQRSVE